MRAPLASVHPVTHNADNWVVDVQCYGNELVCNNSTVNRQITFHDANTLQTTWHCSPHTQTITDYHLTGNNVIVSCSRDGSVQVNVLFLPRTKEKTNKTK